MGRLDGEIMFDGVKNWIRGMINMIFGKTTIEEKINTKIAVSDEMLQHISLWSEMYTDVTPKTLGLPASIANEIARLVTLEMKSEVTGSQRADFLNESYQRALGNIRNQVEYGLAKGGLVMKPYVENGNITVDFVQADCFYPTQFSSGGKITGAVFIERITKGDKYFTRFEHHELTGTVYSVQNTAYRSENKSYLGNKVSLSAVSEWENLAENVTITNVEKPLFGYFKNPFANTICPHSPMGVSVYSRAVDLIHEADRQYERLLWEFESGERALYVDDAAFRRDENGNIRLPNKRLYKAISQDELFEDWSPTFREQNIINGLNKILQRIEFNCGLAYGTISDPQNVDKTAEEIRTSKQRSYANVCDIQKALQNALEELVYAMDVWCTLYRLVPEGKYEMSFDFDDSIIADRQREFAEKQALLSLGIIKPWEFRAWYTGEDEETAKKNVGNVDDEEDVE